MKIRGVILPVENEGRGFPSPLLFRNSPLQTRTSFRWLTRPVPVSLLRTVFHHLRASSLKCHHQRKCCLSPSPSNHKTCLFLHRRVTPLPDHFGLLGYLLPYRGTQPYGGTLSYGGTLHYGVPACTFLGHISFLVPSSGGFWLLFLI